ncbi:MAG TPA: hypothetical protein VIF09_13285 [Polyangiaceae bacterium]|jgi:hypothetical protein
MLRWIAAPLALSALALTATPALAQQPDASVEVALRTGYALPLGSLVSSTNLTDVLTGALPLWIDAGYRLPHLFLGAYLQYAQGFMIQGGASGSTYLANGGIRASTSECGSLGQSCSGFDLKYGIEVQYHLAPDGPLDPWLGYGVGAENLDVHSHGNAFGRSNFPVVSETQSFMALVPVVLQLGADYRLARFGIGPFVMLDLGPYITESQSTAGTTLTLHDTALHEWLTLGARGYFDIALPTKGAP